MSATREVWGAEVSLLTLAAALRARGVDVAVVALPGELAEHARAAGHDVYVADPGAETGRVMVARHLWREYAQHVRLGDRLVLFSYILTAWAPLYRRRLSARGVRIALDLHDQLESRKAFWSVRLTSEAVDTIIACSAFTAAQMGAREGVYALHRPVTTDLADSGIDRSSRSAGTPPGQESDLAASRSVAPGRSAGTVPGLEEGAAEHAARAISVAGMRPGFSPSHGGSTGDAGLPGSDPADRPAPHHAGSAPGGVPGRGARAPLRRPASRAGTLGAAASQPRVHPRTGSARPFRVGIVGRISREKRHELVIAATSLVDRDVQLVIRGSAFGEAQEYAAHVDDEGARLLGPRYVNEGRVPAAEALSGLDAVVVGNPAEPMGRTVLEAQLQGVVAVVPDTGGSCELVENEHTGLVYASDDVDDLARVLVRLIDSPDLAARIARDAVASVPHPAEYAAAYLSRLG